MDIKSIFAPIKRPEYFFWVLLIGAMTLLIVLGNRRFFVDHFIISSNDERLSGWYSLLWHHGATLLLFTLPLLLMKPLGIYRHAHSLFAPGDWRWGLKWTLLACVAVTGPTWVSSNDPQFLREYPLSMMAFDSIPMLALFLSSYLLYYIGWESFFRGFIGFGMTGLGYTPFLAMMVQVSLSTIIHIGKPDMELIGAIPGGILMGLLALRSRSLLWPLLFHFYIGTINTLFCFLHR